MSDPDLTWLGNRPLLCLPVVVCCLPIYCLIGIVQGLLWGLGDWDQDVRLVLRTLRRRVWGTR